MPKAQKAVDVNYKDQKGLKSETRFEYPDQNPVAISVPKPERMSDIVKRYVRTTLSQQARDQGLETFEESEDFDIGEDDVEGLQTLYNVLAMDEEEIAELDASPPGSKEDTSSPGEQERSDKGAPEGAPDDPISTSDEN